ncbi:MAG: hypothetical protein WBN94_09915 [Methanothrix sp.]
MTTEIKETFDPIFDYIGKLTLIKHDGRQYVAKLIALKGKEGEELWFEGRDGDRWMVARSELLYISLVKNQGSVS